MREESKTCGCYMNGGGKCDLHVREEDKETVTKEEVRVAWKKYNHKLIENFHLEGFASNPARRAILHNDFERELGL